MNFLKSSEPKVDNSLSSPLDSNKFSHLSNIEALILRSNEPISLNQETEIDFNGERYVWLNRNEEINWKGEISLSKYELNKDPNPEIITKKSNQTIEYIQELAIRYLKPPNLPPPGEIIINQQPNKQTVPPPPIIIRQQPARPVTPEPLVIREVPPPVPDQIGKKIITISGKRLPPPPRKIVIERLAPLPNKPQAVLIERWLPYPEVKRRVIFNKSIQPDPIIPKPRNVIVQWEAPQVTIRKEYKFLGVIRADPADYAKRYGDSLLNAEELPLFVKEIPTPSGLILASEQAPQSNYNLIGDTDALQLVDLDKEGLKEYKPKLNTEEMEKNYKTETETTNNEKTLSDLVECIFESIVGNKNGRIHFENAQRVILRVNSSLGRKLTESHVNSFLFSLDPSRNGWFNLEEFKIAFFKLAKAR